MLNLSAVSTNELQYLSAKQAIQDLVAFIDFIKKKYNLTYRNKWIAYGGSYPGSLSALIRAKYPNLIHASFSSSAPMFFNTDFKGYMEVMGKSLYDYSNNCYFEIYRAYQYIEQYLQTSQGRATIQYAFKYFLLNKLNCFFRNKRN